MSIAGVIAAEKALRAHVETWIDAYLGVVERTEGLEPGIVPRPALYTRRNSWPVDDIAIAPMVVVVSGGEVKSRVKGSVTIKTFEIRFAAVVKGDGESEEDVGNAARVYAQALGNLLESKRDFGLEGCSIVWVGQVNFADGPADNSKHLGVGRVSAHIDIPYLDRAPNVADDWEPTPSPGRYDEPTPPPVPPAQVAATSVSISVEAVSEPDPVEST